MISKGCLVRAKNRASYKRPAVFLTISEPYVDDYSFPAADDETVIDTLTPRGQVLTFYVDEIEVISKV